MKNIPTTSLAVSLFKNEIRAMFLLIFISPLIAGNPHGEISLDSVTLDTGITLEYAEKGQGNGKVIIFLHGYLDSWFAFSEIMANLPTKYHSYSLSQRGFGESDKPATGYEMTDYSEDVIAFMDHFGINRAHIVGHSMGSVAAQRFAIDHPDRVNKLVLVGSAANMTQNALLSEFREFLVDLTDPVDPELIQSISEGSYFNAIPVEFFEKQITETQKVPADVWREALDGLLLANHSAELELITAPTLIYWGDKDDIFSFDEQQELLEGINDSMLLIYENTGHGVEWEFPVRFAQDLALFLH